MHRLVGVIRIIINDLRFLCMKLTSHNVNIGGFCTSRLDNEWDISKSGKLYLGNHFASLRGCRILIRNHGELIIGEGVGLNTNCTIACHKKIFIGDGAEFGPNVCVYDHDHDFRCEGGIKEGKYSCQEVYIGKNVWIGANTLILKGAKIGNNSVIAGGSIVSGKADIPDNSVFLQKRTTIISSFL